MPVIDPRLTGLRRMLQQALELELFTIPPYLAALYSIREGCNLAAAEIIQGVVMEEMLHMALVANILNAVGGTPRLSPEIVAKEGGKIKLKRRKYPSPAPHVDLAFPVALERFQLSTVNTFANIEAPEDPLDWEVASAKGRIASIGHFYDILLNRIVATCEELGEDRVFKGDLTRQVSAEHYYGAGGSLVPVRSLSDAKDVIAIVSQQGEGRRKISNQTGDQSRFGQPREVAHYFRFEQILVGHYYDRDGDVGKDPSGPSLLVDWSAVYPMADNPDPAATSPDGLGALLTSFDQCYSDVLRGLHLGFNGQAAALFSAVTAMHELKHASVALMRTELGNGKTSGPPFWFVTLVE